MQRTHPQSRQLLHARDAYNKTVSPVRHYHQRLRGATFLGLAISLVLLAVLALIVAKELLPEASNIITTTTLPGTPPGQTSPISGAANDLALANSLSVADDAIAIAVGSGRAPQESDLAIAASESSPGQGNVSITQPLGSDPASPRMVQFSVQINGAGTVNVCLVIPNVMGGTPVQVPCG
jgi:hypothetical protein